MSSRLLVFLILSAVLLCPSVWAQSSAPKGFQASSPSDSTTSSPPLQRGAHFLNGDRLSLWFGGSLEPGRIIGKMAEGRFALLGLRYHRRLFREPSESPSDKVTLTYTADFFPAAFLSIPPHTIPASHLAPGKEIVWQSGLRTYGLGANPLGIRINHRATDRLQPFIAGSAGFIYFFLPIPDQRGMNLNFTVDAGLGVQVVLTSTTTLTLGYRYHHLSNGFRGKINPGVDANLLYLGVTLVP